jgi:hypothetical protein
MLSAGAAYGTGSPQADETGAAAADPPGSPTPAEINDLLAHLSSSSQAFDAGALGAPGFASLAADERAAPQAFDRGTAGAFGTHAPRGPAASSPRGNDAGSASAYGGNAGVGLGDAAGQRGLPPDPRFRPQGSGPGVFAQRAGAAGGHQVKHAPVGDLYREGRHFQGSELGAIAIVLLLLHFMVLWGPRRP